MLRQTTVLMACIAACTAMRMPCVPYESSAYEGVAWECSGIKVRRVPTLLRPGLQMLVLTGTAISSLNGDSFHGRHLEELKILNVTAGHLASVGPHAFCHLPALNMLYLEHNQLEMLDALSFSCNGFLRTVSLVDNPGLHHLPQLVSSSVRNLYLDNCSLSSVDAATFERMTALRVLSLTGNTDLHCPSVISHFKQARPDLLVTCEDPDPNLPSSAFPEDQESTSVRSHTASDSDIGNEKKDTTDNSASRIALQVSTIAGIPIVIILIFVTVRTIRKKMLIILAKRTFGNNG